jgi:hypothetical protein
MKTCMNLWDRLSGITSLRFVARSANDTGWNGSGNGNVAIEHLDANTITFTETGQWTTETGKQLNFSNVYRWSLLESASVIRLEHLRFGENSPVYLFDLVPGNDRNWHSTEPHLCRDDLYSATMRLDPDKIELRWTIKGPQKDEDIHYLYS